LKTKILIFKKIGKSKFAFEAKIEIKMKVKNVLQKKIELKK
jgi:hypothetical protein